MKKGLVLAGGGSKGAYHIGAIMALLEEGYSPDIVTGVSIGALIGCMVAENKVQDVIDLWKRVTVNDVIADGVSLNVNMEEMFDQKQEVIRFFKQTLKEKRVNIDPLKEMIHEALDYDALMDSKIDFGLVTYMISKNRPVMITKKEMTRENCENYLLASASCFPAFPVCTFDGESYVDGGYVDNCPVELAIKMGAEELIVIDLNDKPQHPEFFGRSNILYLYPQDDLGSFLDFDRNELNRRIQLGYWDTMKALKKLEGVRCTFRKDQFKSELLNQYYWTLLDWEIKLNKGKVKKNINPFTAQPVSAAIKTYAKEMMIDSQDYGKVAFDMMVTILNHEKEKELLNVDECILSAKEYYFEHVEALNLIISEIKEMKLPALKKLLKRISDKELVIVICQLILDKGQSTLLLLLMAVFSKEFAAALFLSLLVKE